MRLRRTARLCVLVTALFAAAGCVDDPLSTGQLDTVWGRRGISDGRFQKPRAMAIDDEGTVYIVDMTARIQAFDSEGNFLRSWQTPAHENGRPTGISVDRRGRVLVADTHYYRVLVYSPEGQLLETLGGKEGHAPGEMGLVTDAVQDSQGNYYVAEYGEYDRVQKFSPQGEFLLQWGGHGSEPGEFLRPQNLLIDEEDRIWVADACNHRIQVFDSEGNLLSMWGEQGSALGQLYYPYDLVFGPDGNLIVCEYGNHRVAKVHSRRKVAGMLGKKRPQGRRAAQSLGASLRPAGKNPRVGYEQPSNQRITM